MGDGRAGYSGQPVAFHGPAPGGGWEGETYNVRPGYERPPPPPAPGETFVGQYILGDTLGKGSTAKVKVATKRRQPGSFAIKIVRKSLLTENTDARQRVEREIKILRLLRHPFIMRMHEVMQTSTHLFIVLEHLSGGELYEYVLQRQQMHMDECFRIFYQIVKGVLYMHQQNICHRDLKLENILIDSEQNVKLSDFGMASAMPSHRWLETSCGSPHYACPEIVRGDRYRGPDADAWSIGVLLYAIATSSLPFDDPSIEVLFEKIKSGQYCIADELPLELRDCIGRLLQVDNRERLKVEDIQRTQFWVSNAPSLPEDMTEEYQMARMDQLGLQTMAAATGVSGPRSGQ